MKKRIRIVGLGVVVMLGLIGVLWFQLSPEAPEGTATESHSYNELPVKGMVTMIDLGARSCIPCKMMAPIMKKVEEKYKGKAAILFIDVWKNQAPAKRFGIGAIPTQIFFDKEGREVYRHVGFMSEESIVKQLKRMGVPDAEKPMRCFPLR